MKTYIFDIETDGLYWDASVVHMIAIGNERGDVKVLEDIDKALKILDRADRLVGHNIIAYDLPVLKKLTGWEPREDVEIFDTMIAAKLMYRDMYLDDTHQQRDLPPRLMGSHSLEAWGFRLGVLKDDFGKRTDWSLTDANREEFIAYAAQDVRVTKALYDFILPKVEEHWDAFEMETKVAQIINRQHLYGFYINKKRAQELLGKYYEEIMELEEKFQQMFPPWQEKVGVYKRDNKKRGIKAGDPKLKEVKFNPGSRQHIAKALMEAGWKPQEFTETGQPKVDETTLEALAERIPIAHDFARYLKLQKLIGMLAEGGQAILKHIKDDQRVHGEVDTLGAVSRRMTHRNPNVAQTPSDHEFRELYCVPEGKKLVGIDASGLELRCLAHYLTPYDKGRYTHTILTGDIHTMNQQAAGLDTRQQAKRFIYAFLYGAGAPLIGEIAGGNANTGYKLKERFLRKTPGLKKLLSKVDKRAAQGFIKSLDGVPLPIRSPHKALNLLLQSAGAIVMKRALVILDKDLQEHGYVPGKDYEFVANVHDEWQIECNEKIAEDVAKIGVEAIRKAGEYYSFRCPLDGEAQIGTNWADTH